MSVESIRGSRGARAVVTPRSPRRQRPSDGGGSATLADRFETLSGRPAGSMAMTNDREGADAADVEGGNAADVEGGEAANVEGGNAADVEGGEAADVDASTVRHIASLARVDLDDDEVDRFVDQFAEILGYFEALEDVPDIDGEPDLVNVMRSDEITEGLTQAEALRNAPETEDGRFRGPRVS